MIHSEKEARHRWCPYARSVELAKNTPAYNRKKSDRNVLTVMVDTCCVASDCMAWRFIDDPSRDAVRPPSTAS